MVQREELSLSIQSKIKSSINENKLSVETDAFEIIAVNRCSALAWGNSITVSVLTLMFSFATSNNCLIQPLTVF